MRKILKWGSMSLMMLMPAHAAEAGLPKEVFMRLPLPAPAVADANMPDWNTMKPNVLYVYRPRSGKGFSALMKVHRARSLGAQTGLAETVSRVEINGRNINIVNLETKITIDDAAIHRELPPAGSSLYGGGTLDAAGYQQLFQHEKQNTWNHENLHAMDNMVNPESTMKIEASQLEAPNNMYSYEQAMQAAQVSVQDIDRLKELQREMDILTEARAMREEMSKAYDHVYQNMVFGDAWDLWQAVVRNEPVPQGVSPDIWQMIQKQSSTVVPFVQKDDMYMTYGELFKLLEASGKDNARQTLSDMIIDSRLQHAHEYIDGTSVRYEEAYNKYFKKACSLDVLDDGQIFNGTEELMGLLAADYKKLLQNAWNKIYDYLESISPEKVVSYSKPPRQGPPAPRKVCLPCRFRDTIGRCSKPGCCNFGKLHRDYKQKPGDRNL